LRRAACGVDWTAGLQDRKTISVFTPLVITEKHDKSKYHVIWVNLLNVHKISYFYIESFILISHAPQTPYRVPLLC
jgi:hypothetical protein